MARRLGLRPFDASLAIAMVQDAARRGTAPGQIGLGSSDLSQQLALLPVANPQKTRPYKNIASITASAFFLATALVALAILWVSGGG